jgi:hypothetical protein
MPLLISTGTCRNTPTRGKPRSSPALDRCPKSSVALWLCCAYAVLASFYPCGGICKAAEALQAFLVPANPRSESTIYS